MSRSRWSAVAEAHLRELARRRVAMLLLIALPLAFYGALSGHDGAHAIRPGTVSASFSISGAAIFVVLAGRAIDDRLMLSGYRRIDLLTGRLVSVLLLAVVVVAVTSSVMVSVSHPARPAIAVLAVIALAVVAIPVGLLIGTLVGRDLEAVLVLIGLVGVQLSLDIDQTLSKLLPFYGPRRLVEIALGDHTSIMAAVGATIGYAVAATAAMAAVARVRLRAPGARGTTTP